MSKLKQSHIYPVVNPCRDKWKRGEVFTCSGHALAWKNIGKMFYKSYPKSLILTRNLTPRSPFWHHWRGRCAPDSNQMPHIVFASLLAMQSVLLRWRDAAPPTHAQWLRDIMSCLNLEKICYSVCNSNKKFQKLWGNTFRIFSQRFIPSLSFPLLSMCL